MQVVLQLPVVKVLFVRHVTENSVRDILLERSTVETPANCADLCSRIERAESFSDTHSGLVANQSASHAGTEPCDSVVLAIEPDADLVVLGRVKHTAPDTRGRNLVFRAEARKTAYRCLIHPGGSGEGSPYGHGCL